MKDNESTETLPVEFSQKFFTEQEQQQILRRKFRQKSPETIKKLNEATPKNLIKQREKGGKRFDYVEGVWVRDQLDKIDPNHEIIIVQPPTLICNCIVTSVELIIEGVRRSGTGSAPVYVMKKTGKPDADKRPEASITFAIKNAAMAHGKCRDLWKDEDYIDNVDTNTGEIKDKETDKLNEAKVKIDKLYKQYLDLIEKHGHPRAKLDDKLKTHNVDPQKYTDETFNKMLKLYQDSMKFFDKNSVPKSDPPKEQKKEEPESGKPKFITEKQLDRFYKMMEKAGIKYDDTYRQSPLKSHYKIDRIEDISKEDYRIVTDRLQEIIDDNKKQTGIQVNLDDDLPF